MIVVLVWDIDACLHRLKFQPSSRSWRLNRLLRKISSPTIVYHAYPICTPCVRCDPSYHCNPRLSHAHTLSLLQSLDSKHMTWVWVRGRFLRGQALKNTQSRDKRFTQDALQANAVHSSFDPRLQCCMHRRPHALANLQNQMMIFHAIFNLLDFNTILHYYPITYD